ncbi:hypothetical protein THAOC_13907, partial [Thalassiosira oceanica]
HEDVVRVLDAVVRDLVGTPVLPADDADVPPQLIDHGRRDGRGEEAVVRRRRRGDARHVLAGEGPAEEDRLGPPPRPPVERRRTPTELPLLGPVLGQSRPADGRGGVVCVHPPLARRFVIAIPVQAPATHPVPRAADREGHHPYQQQRHDAVDDVVDGGAAGGPAGGGPRRLGQVEGGPGHGQGIGRPWAPLLGRRRRHF